MDSLLLAAPEGEILSFFCCLSLLFSTFFSEESESQGVFLEFFVLSEGVLTLWMKTVGSPRLLAVFLRFAGLLNPSPR